MMSLTNVPDELSPRRFPVALRKVPAMTGWSVDELAKILHGERFAGSSFLIERPPPFLIAYDGHPGFKPIVLHRQDWDYPCRMIKDLADKYIGKEEREGGQDFYDKWRREALGHIHPSWFVWSNDLKDAFDNYEDPDTMIRLDGPNIFRWEIPSSKDLTLIFECPDELLSERDIELKKQSQASLEKGGVTGAKNESGGQQGSKSGLVFPTPPGTKWEGITIKFVDGHTVYITAGGESGRYSYEGMGMNNQTSSKPNIQWTLLEKLANSKGEMNFRSDSKLKSRKKLLAKALRKFFGLKDDPFKYQRGKYKAIFVINPQS